MGNACFGQREKLKTVNEIYAESWTTQPPRDMFGLEYESSTPASPILDWGSEISVDYFSDTNCKSNQVLTGFVHYPFDSSKTGQNINTVKFASVLNQSFIISYSDLMLNAQRAPNALHPILKKPKHSLNSRSFINFISNPSCIETPDNIVSCHCLAKANKNESCSPTPSGG